MELNFLGKSGLRVSNIGLGTMTFGTSNEGPMDLFYYNPKNTDEPTSHAILDKYVEYGGNFIDTANVYSHGNSEKIIGTWLQRHQRNDFVLATKVRFPLDLKSPNSVGLSRRNIVKSCEESLERLKTNYIDLYQAHAWDSATPVEETLRTFDDLIRSGLVRYYGYSNVCGWMLQKVAEIAKYMGLAPCVSLQQKYNLLRRDSELESITVCENEGIGLLAWNPLKGDLLSGKYKRQTSSTQQSQGPEGNVKLDKVKNEESYWNMMGILNRIAKAHEKSVSQVSIRWLLQKNVVSSVIVGVPTLQHLEDYVGAATGWKLSPEEMKELDETRTKRIEYPYDIIWGITSRSNRFTNGPRN